jgi:hypothetical protein
VEDKKTPLQTSEEPKVTSGGKGKGKGKGVHVLHSFRV